jgi:hypothetical protein
MCRESGTLDHLVAAARYRLTNVIKLVFEVYEQLSSLVRG